MSEEFLCPKIESSTQFMCGVYSNDDNTEIQLLCECVHYFILSKKMKLTVLLLALIFANIFSNGNSETFHIGAIFDKLENGHREKAFVLSVEKLNKQLQDKHTIIPIISYVPPHDAFKAMTATCEMIEKGVVGILGPSTSENSNMVQSICDNKDIPLLDVRWNDQPSKPIINVYPYQNMLTEVYLDIIDAWNFRNFVILYENNDSLNRVGELLKHFDSNRGGKVLVRQLDKTHSGNYRPTLKEVWRSGATQFVLDCSIDILDDVLRQAQQVGLMTSQQSYIITNLDFHTLELIPYQYADTNITGMRFIDPEAESIRNLAFELYKTADVPDTSNFGFIAAWKVQLETALINDAIMMFGQVFRDLPKNFKAKSLNCSLDDVWSFGSTVINLVKGLKYHGLTGTIQFDMTGNRSEFGLEVVELREGGITRVGNWTTSHRLNITRHLSDVQVSDDRTLVNKTFVVSTCLTEPYGMRKESAVPLYGNDRYEGFGIDLIDELSKRLQFNYTFIIREDKKNGEYDKVTGKWNGMIGDVIDGIADLAITDLTITFERESAVDFTSPFMNLGISMLYHKPKKAPPSFFSFADPFAVEVWKSLALAFFGVSLALFVMGRISPAEWQNPYPCIEQPEYLVNQLSLRNCFWFSTGSLMQQGSEIAPLAYSTRMVAGMWFFFTLIMVASYTANLAAFLTTESPDVPFNDVFELMQVAERKGIKFGAKSNGSTANFFRDSTIAEYQQIYEYMNQNAKDVMVKDNEQGVKKAEQENYVFFMEITSIEYETQRRCNLTSVGGMLDEKGYGIAMRKNSTYRGLLSTEILKMQEEGDLAKLKRKWWEERRGGGQCMGESESTEATPLNLKNVGGVFWVTLMGAIFSLILVFIEMALHMFKKSVKTKTPFRLLVIEELKFYFKFSGMVKPVIYNNSPERSEKSESKSPKGSLGENLLHSRPIGFVATVSEVPRGSRDK